jgi:hypothetical protein
MGNYAGLILDIIVLCALAATILYARKLSKQFAETRADRKAFEKLIEAINNATARADIATRSLREAAQASGDHLQDKINAARGLADELEIVIEAGDHLASRLEGAGRKSVAPLRETPVAREPFPREDIAERNAPERISAAQPRTRAEKELLEALRAKQQSS